MALARAQALLLGQGRAAGLAGARAFTSSAAAASAATEDRPRNMGEALSSLSDPKGLNHLAEGPEYLHDSYSHAEYYHPRRRIMLNSLSDPMPGWLNSSMSDAHYELPGHVRVAPTTRPRQGFKSARSSAGTNMQRIVVVTRSSVSDPGLHDSYSHGDYTPRKR